MVYITVIPVTTFRNPNSWTRLQNVLYICFGRPLWSLGLAILSCSCISCRPAPHPSQPVPDPVERTTYTWAPNVPQNIGSTVREACHAARTAVGAGRSLRDRGFFFSFPVKDCP